MTHTHTARERESVCVSMCVRERESEREGPTYMASMLSKDLLHEGHVYLHNQS